MARSFIKLIVIIVSIICLILKVRIIYDQYVSGNTLVSIKIGQLTDLEIPAITICYHGMYSMERAGKFDSDFKKINEKYIKSIKNLYRSYYYLSQKNPGVEDREILLNG